MSTKGLAAPGTAAIAALSATATSRIRLRIAMTSSGKSGCNVQGQRPPALRCTVNVLAAPAVDTSRAQDASAALLLDDQDVNAVRPVRAQYDRLLDVAGA